MTTREKIFKTLLKHPGSTIAEVVKRTKLNPKSGSIAVIFWSGVSARLLKKGTKKIENREVRIYSVTPAGEKALKEKFPNGSGVGEFLKKKGWLSKADKKSVKKKAKVKVEPLNEAK
jgi:DNA-binding PadR family transcriptional regulator